MSATATLVESSLAYSKEAEHNVLRALTLGNLAAGMGSLGASEHLIAAIPLDPERPPDAAFLNAMRLHARTQDDFFPQGRVHVGAITLAAALALADHSQVDIFHSLAVGYETMCAVSAPYAPTAQARGLRPSGVFGPLGAAATAATVIGLDIDGVAGAVGLAASMSAGTTQAWLSGSDEWLLEAGAAARAGVEAALFIEAGASAAPLALEGRAGWARALFDDEGARTLLAALDEPTSRIGAVAAKLYPVSGIAQIPTYLACQAKQSLNGDVPDHIGIRLSEEELAYPGSANTGPYQSRSDALMSVVFCAACGLIDGGVRLARLEHPNDPTLERVAARFKVAADSELGETEAVLEFAARGEMRRLEGNGRGLLHPSWDELARNLELLADRCEANHSTLQEAHDELLAKPPDPGHLRRLLWTSRA